MPDAPIGEASLEVVDADGSHHSVRITESPFFIGRGGGTGNHLQLADACVSRRAAAILFDADRFHIEDRGQRGGLFIHGEKITKHRLDDGDLIRFGVEGPCEITFRSPAANISVDHLLTRIESMSRRDTSGGGLSKLNLLLEATTLLHSQLPLDAVLATMLDHTVAVTGADRGLFLEPDSYGDLRIRLGPQQRRQAPGERKSGAQPDGFAARDR